MLQEKYPDIDITLVNSGTGGSTTRDRLPLLEKDVLAHHPDLVIADFAANDADYNPDRHVYLDEFSRNIRYMHEQIVQKTGAAEIYWPQTPEMSEKHVWRNQPLYADAGGLDKYDELYRKCTAKVSRELNVPFVDMDAIFRKKIKENGSDFYLCPDGAHHTKAGNQLVAESLFPLVDKFVKNKVSQRLTVSKNKSRMVNSKECSTFIVKLWSDSIPGSIDCPDYKEGVNNINCSEMVSSPEMTVFLPSKKNANGTAILICPGGGYSCVTYYWTGVKEIAKWFNDQGIAAFILKYRLPSDKIMKDKSIGPLQDAQKAMRIIRGNAAKWHINTAKIGALGWSSGGHFVATLATHYNAKVYNDGDIVSARPDFTMLLCPVISFEDSIGHKRSRENLLGQNPDHKTIKYFSADQQVSTDTPPAFLAHCADDVSVSTKNSFAYFFALQDHKIPAEIHIYQKGGHDGLFKDTKILSSWFSTCLLWLRANGWL